METEKIFDYLAQKGIEFSGSVEGLLESLIARIFIGREYIKAKRLAEPVAQTVYEIAYAREKLERLEDRLLGYTLRPFDAERFSDINFQSIATVFKQMKIENIIKFTHQNQDYTLRVNLRRETKEKVSVAEYFLDDESLGSIVGNAFEIASHTKEAIDRGIFLPKARAFAEEHLDEIAAVLLTQIERDILTTSYGERCEEPQVLLGVNTTLGLEGRFSFYEAPQVKAAYKSKVHGIDISVGIKADVFYIPGGRFGLFGYRERDEVQQARTFDEKYGTSLLAYWDEGKFVVDPAFNVEEVDAELTFTKRGIPTKQEAHDAKLKIQKQIKDSKYYYLDPYCEANVNGEEGDYSIEFRVDLRPNMESYRRVLNRDPQNMFDI